MTARVKWTDRTFAFDFPSDIYPELLERLRGTPARLDERVRVETLAEAARATSARLAFDSTSFAVLPTTRLIELIANRMGTMNTVTMVISTMVIPASRVVSSVCITVLTDPQSEIEWRSVDPQRRLASQRSP